MAGALGYYVWIVKDSSVPLEKGSATLDFKHSYEGTQGLSGYVIIYNKKKDEICFYREQFFIIGRDPLYLPNIKKQIKNAFKEIHT